MVGSDAKQQEAGSVGQKNQGSATKAGSTAREKEEHLESSPKKAKMDIQAEFDHALNHKMSMAEVMYMKLEEQNEDMKMELMKR